MNSINVYKTPSGNWVIEKLNSNYSGTQLFSINGREENIPAGQNVEIKDKPTSIIKIESKTEISHYKNSATAILPVQEYDNSIFELKKKEYCVDDEYSWESLEDEFAYKKFVQTWKPIYKQVKVESVYEIVFKELPVSIYDFIVPYYQFGGQSLSNPTCIYTAPTVRMLIAAAEKYGFTRLENRASYEMTKGKKWSYDDSLQYIKINGHYPLAKDVDKWWARTDTYEKCIELYNEHSKFVDDLFSKESRLIDNEPITENERAEILTSLKVVQSHLSEVEPKNKSYNDYNLAVTKLRNVIDRI